MSLYIPIEEKPQLHNKRQLIVFKEDKKGHNKGKHSDIIAGNNGALPKGDIYKTTSQEFKFQGDISFYNKFMQYKNHPVLFDSGKNDVDSFPFFKLLKEFDETKYLEMHDVVLTIEYLGKLLFEIYDVSKYLKNNIILDFPNKNLKRDQHINNKHIKYSTDY